VAVTTSAPQTSRRLPAVDPNVSKALAIVAMSQTIFGLVSLYLNNYAAEVCYFEYFLRFLVSHQGDEEEGEGIQECHLRSERGVSTSSA
jgi:hypothetical protein